MDAAGVEPHVSKRFAFLYYRDWADNLIANVREDRWGSTDKYTDFAELAASPIVHDAYFLIGWSDLIPEDFYLNKLVLVLHPSPLPEFRGGSPIQHQIMAGKTESAVTLFQLHPDYPGIDTGPIYGSLPYSLEGTLKDVLGNIADRGSLLVSRAIEDIEMGCFEVRPQTLIGDRPTYKRRTPAQSEITMNFIEHGSAKSFHNFVRALDDPYPRPFIQYWDGRLYITQTIFEPQEEEEA